MTSGRSQGKTSETGILRRTSSFWQLIALLCSQYAVARAQGQPSNPYCWRLDELDLFIDLGAVCSFSSWAKLRERWCSDDARLAKRCSWHKMAIAHAHLNWLGHTTHRWKAENKLRRLVTCTYANFQWKINDLARNPSVLFPFSMIFEAAGSFKWLRLKKKHWFKLEWFLPMLMTDWMY